MRGPATLATNTAGAQATLANHFAPQHCMQVYASRELPLIRRPRRRPPCRGRKLGNGEPVASVPGGTGFVDSTQSRCGCSHLIFKKCCGKPGSDKTISTRHKCISPVRSNEYVQCDDYLYPDQFCTGLEDGVGPFRKLTFPRKLTHLFRKLTTPSEKNYGYAPASP